MLTCDEKNVEEFHVALQFKVGPAAEFRPCWKLDYSAPEIEG